MRAWGDICQKASHVAPLAHRALPASPSSWLLGCRCTLNPSEFPPEKPPMGTRDNPESKRDSKSALSIEPENIMAFLRFSSGKVIGALRYS
jgi:hypothetical protein